MNVLILTAGSRGDVQPYVALGKGLREAGHAVTVCTHARFEALVTEHGLAYAYLGDDLLALLDTPAGRGALEDMGSLLSGARTALEMLKRSGPIQQALLDDGWAAVQKTDPDLLLYNSKMGGAPHYADKLGIPAVLAMLFPQLVPTVAFPTLGFPDGKLGERYNRASYAVVLRIARSVGSRYIRDWRAMHGLPPQPRRTDLLHRSDGSRIPVLHGLSPLVVPEPADWPDTAVMTGYWFLDRPPEWTPPPALEAFLASGAQPVYVGFGSMAGRDPQRTARIVNDALQRAGLRGVLATGWGGLAPADHSDRVFYLDAVPHDWLFPRVAAVVHHGGAGTTAAGLRAGRPTIVCPFFGDQPFWGRRVYELGVGSAPIPQKKLSADDLAAALREVTTSRGIRERAEALGERIRREDGIVRAVSLLEEIGRV